VKPFGFFSNGNPGQENTMKNVLEIISLKVTDECPGNNLQELITRNPLGFSVTKNQMEKYNE
jgi:hypothetical protein